jgi:hypothetical protein
MRSALLLLMFATAGVTPLGAQSSLPADPMLAGVFVHDAAASDDLEAVVDRAVKLVRSPIKRMFARGRLRGMNTPHAWVQIELRGDSLRVVTDLWDVTVPPTGDVLSRKPDGELFRVSGSWEGQAFRQVWLARDGRRENVFAVTEDGNTLTMDVEMHSGQLREPLRYRQVYLRRRDESGHGPRPSGQPHAIVRR